MINAENELHENILTTLSHTYKIQRILGSARIKIINRSVFPNTIWEKLFTLFWLGAATVSIVYYEVYYYMRYYPLNFVLYVACAVGILSQYIIYVINVVYDKMLYRPGDAEIYFLIQKVNQKLMLHRCTYLTKSHVMLNYIFLTLVFTLAAIVSIWTYIIIGTSIIAVRTQLYSLISTITVAMWAGFYFIQLAVLSIMNDTFMKEVKNTKLLCIRILSYSFDDAVMKIASKILREFKYSPPTFSVYGIFILDTRISLHLLSLVTANIMIVIQFSY
ncbi:hypothetical protein O3G_MSEX006756 [Manduca sexta]|uniref:Gustatory receptor n=1 Tax=Manduca sexta TaxID=7130 RepID=A0A921Z3E0_MANSE|nr:hypothetical protein O3G_MSEX006756 [Manduca sexta]